MVVEKTILFLFFEGVTNEHANLWKSFL